MMEAEREALRDRLELLLNASQLDAHAFWGFVADLGAKCGVTDDLHSAGVIEAEKARGIVPQAGETEYDVSARADRAYQLTVLRQFLFEAGNVLSRTDRGSSILPEDFRVHELCGDISIMLGGKYGTGDGPPQFLFSNWKGLHFFEGHGRTRFVGAIYFEAARRDGVAPISLLSPFGARSLKSSTWRRWVEDAGPAVTDAATAAGKAGDMASQWNLSPEFRIKLWELIDPTPRAKK